jgi:hypothetical protein
MLSWAAAVIAMVATTNLPFSFLFFPCPLMASDSRKGIPRSAGFMTGSLHILGWRTAWHGVDFNVFSFFLSSTRRQ